MGELNYWAKFFKLLYIYARKGFSLRLAITSDIDFDVAKALTVDTIIGHPYGITIGKGVKIGKGCLLSQNITIGKRYPAQAIYFPENRKDDGMPEIGDYVYIAPNAVVAGNIKVGSHAHIGANAVVLKDVEPGQTVVGVWR